MKRLTDRTEIASAINFRKYPVVTIDLADVDEYGIKGAKVLIDNGFFKSGEPYYIKAKLRAYSDEKVLQFSQGAEVLSASFTYSDMEEILEYSNAPIIKADQDILICPINSAIREAYAPILLHTGKRIDAHCSTPLTLEKFEII